MEALPPAPVVGAGVGASAAALSLTRGPPRRPGAPGQEEAGTLEGAVAAAVGGGPGQGASPRRPEEEEEANILHWRAEVERRARGLKLCQGVPRNGAFLPSQPQVLSRGQEIPGDSRAGLHKLPASPPQPQPHLDVGVPG